LDSRTTRGKPSLAFVHAGAFPVLYAVMVWLEASVSGTSTNPARIFGPQVISGAFSGWWIY
jgi:aquaporin Z